MRARLKFLADTDRPLVYVPSKGGGDETDHLGNFAPYEVEIRDARSVLPSPSLDAEGFLVCQQSTQVTDFYDDDELRSIYHAEVVELLIQLTGAHRIEVFDDTRRAASRETRRQRGIREPANIVHNDYTARSGITRLRDHFATDADEVDRLLERRFAILNVWRSIAGPVVDHPLVLCDATSVRAQDLVAMERRADERIGELQVARFHPAQRWYYFPVMQPDEALVFKTFDSASDGRTRFTVHSSCEDPSAPADAPARESIETRCFAFF